MSGPKPDYPISLTEAERTNLEELVRAHKSGQAQVMRAQIGVSRERTSRVEQKAYCSVSPNE